MTSFSFSLWIYTAALQAVRRVVVSSGPPFDRLRELPGGFLFISPTRRLLGCVIEDGASDLDLMPYRHLNALPVSLLRSRLPLSLGPDMTSIIDHGRFGSGDVKAGTTISYPTATRWCRVTACLCAIGCVK